MTDQMVVFADKTVTGARLAKVEAVVAKLGSAARLIRTRTPYRYLMSGVAGSWMHAWPQHDFGIAKYFSERASYIMVT